MGRNLDRRIELMVPVLDPQCKAQVSKSLHSYFDDNVSAYEMKEDGHYQRLAPLKQARLRSQEQHYQAARELREDAEATSLAFRPARAAGDSA